MELSENEKKIIELMRFDLIFRSELLDLVIKNQQQEIQDLEYALKEKTS